jgi:hypothetical protein
VITSTLDGITPTPEMIQKFNKEIDISETLMKYGFWICFISICFLIVLWFIKKKRKNITDVEPS